MNTLIIALVGLLLGGMVAIGVWASKKRNTADDFFVGGRRFGPFVSSATQIAATFGGGVILAQVGIGYRWGFAVLVYSSIAAPLGVLLLARYFARWLRSQNFYTTTDWMCQQYGESKSLRVLTSAVVSLYAVAAAVAQPIAAGKILSVTTGLPFEVCLIISSAVVIIYTTAGGIVAVAYTDVAQLAVMVLLIVVLLPWTMFEAGGIARVFAAVPKENLTLFAVGNDVLLAWFLAVLPATMVKQTYHIRIFGAKSEAIAARGLYNLAIAGCLVGIWAALMGMSIYAINPGLQDPEHATVWVVRNLLPPWLMVIVMAAMVAAVAAAADSALHSFSSSFTHDIYQTIIRPNATDRQLRRVSQLTVVAVGVIGIAIAIAIPVVLDALLLGYSLTASGLFFPLVLGRFWKGATHAGAIAGILAGVSFTVLFNVIDGLTKYLPAVAAGLLASLIALVVVSKFYRRTAAAVLQRS